MRTDEDVRAQEAGGLEPGTLRDIRARTSRQPRGAERERAARWSGSTRFLRVVVRGARSIDDIDWRAFVRERVEARRSDAERERRWEKWRPWILCGGGLVFAVAVVAVAFWTPLFSIRTVEVSGAEHMAVEEVRRLAGVLGEHVLAVDVGDVENSVELASWVEDADVSRALPSTVRISIVEHRAAALLQSGGAPVVVASDGTVLGEVPDLDRLLYPAIPVPGESPEAGTVWRDEAGRALLAALVQLPEDVQQRLESVGRGERGVEAVVRSGPRVIFGSGDDMEAKGRALRGVLADLEVRGESVAYVDVTSPSSPAIESGL